MQQQTIGYIIGGVIPAVLLGVYSVFQKVSAKQGISPGMFLVVLGVNIIIIGLAYNFILGEWLITVKSGIMASLTGMFWAVATCCISVALSKFNVPVSKLVPLFNMNTLVAVCLGLLVFAEWKNVSILKLLAASLLIIIGGTLATKA